MNCTRRIREALWWRGGGLLENECTIWKGQERWVTVYISVVVKGQHPLKHCYAKRLCKVALVCPCLCVCVEKYNYIRTSTQRGRGERERESKRDTLKMGKIYISWNKGAAQIGSLSVCLCVCVCEKYIIICGWTRASEQWVSGWVG